MNQLCWLPIGHPAQSFPPVFPFSFLPHGFGQLLPPATTATIVDDRKEQSQRRKVGSINMVNDHELTTKITKQPTKVEEDFTDRIGESARNRFGRPYISGRPLLLCDRQKIIRLYAEGRRKIAIAREIGVTHSCVSKVIRRYEETGELENKNSRTASCACPGEAETHDLRVCRHVRFNRLRKERREDDQQQEIVGHKHSQHQQDRNRRQQLQQVQAVQQPVSASKAAMNAHNKTTKTPTTPVENPLPSSRTKFSIDWILGKGQQHQC